MLKMIRIAVFAAASVATLGLCPAANAQGIYIEPGGVGVDTGVRVDDGYGREYRGDGEYRRHREHRRDYGYDRRHFRDNPEYDGGYARRRHRHEQDRQDSEQ